MKVICVNDNVTNSKVIPPIVGEYYTLTSKCPKYANSWFVKELPLAKDGQSLVSYHECHFAPTSNIDERELLEQRQTQYA